MKTLVQMAKAQQPRVKKSIVRMVQEQEALLRQAMGRPPRTVKWVYIKGEWVPK